MKPEYCKGSHTEIKSSLDRFMNAYRHSIKTKQYEEDPCLQKQLERKVRCPECRRRLKARLRFCCEGNCFNGFFVPQHKPK